MEGGRGAAGGGGGGLYAAQEPRERRQGEEDEKAKAGRQPPAGGGMKFRVSARAPHGVGALLLIGGAVLAGAAAVAWRHARRGRRPAKKEDVADGGVVEDGKVRTDEDDQMSSLGGASAELETDRPDNNVLQGGASPREIDRPDDDNSRGEEEETEIGSNGLDNGRVTEEIQEVRDDAEIVVEGSVCSSLRAFELQNSERIEKLDLDLGKSSTEISMHHDVDSVEKHDNDSSTRLSEITAHDTDTVTVEKVTENNTTKEDTEADHNSTENDTDNDQDSIANHTENESLSKNELEKQIALNPNDIEEVEASDEHSQNISHPGMVLDEQSLRSDGAKEAESMENSPTSKLITHQEQLSEDTTMDTEGETAEAKLEEEGTVSDRDVPEQGQQKSTAEPVGLAVADSPGLSSLVKPTEKREAEPVGLAVADSTALSSLVKPTEKKEAERPGRIETGMKVVQDDYISNGGLKERALIGKGGGGGDDVTVMDRRSSSSMAILALMFALTIGVAIVVRLYAPPRATKLQMDLQ